MTSMRKQLSEQLITLSHGYGVVALIYVLARLLAGNRWNLIACLGNLLFWLALLGLLGMIILLLHRRWKLALLHLPILIVFLVTYGDHFRAVDPPPIPDNSIPLTIVTYNIESHASEKDEILAVLRTLDADVIGIQELGNAHAVAIEKEFREEYPYQALYPAASQYGTGLLSRYPVLESELIFAEDYLVGKGTAIRVVIEVEGRPVTIYVAHFPVPMRFGLQDGLVVYDETVRDARIRTVKSHIEQETQPTLVLCDCNMTDQNSGYQILAGVLKDAFHEAGQGLGFTCSPQPIPIPPIFPRIWRIDYIWYSDAFIAEKAFVGNHDGTSDHRPLTAHLWLMQFSEIMR